MKKKKQSLKFNYSANSAQLQFFLNSKKITKVLLLVMKM